MASSKPDFFKPGKAAAQAKSDVTHSAFRLIQDAEAIARKKKTEKLKALRMAQPAAPVAEKTGRKKRQDG
jgi:hypothetical protein